MIDHECGAVDGMRIGRGTEVLGENLPHCHFVHHKSHMTWPGLEPGKPATNRLSYGLAPVILVSQCVFSIEEEGDVTAAVVLSRSDANFKRLDTFLNLDRQFYFLKVVIAHN
jgi:hypothetical protein